MANPEHLKILMQGAEVWNQWRKCFSGNPDLQWVMLPGAKLAKFNFSKSDLSKASLIRADLSYSDLSEADLSGAILADIDLTCANLSGANLMDANLSMAGLRGANLSRIHASGVNLFAANLTDANLPEADLCGARLAYARLVRADLTSAKFDRARFFGTLMADSDLGGAQALATCFHRGPSSIDFRTLRRSGMLPEAFLRGCGLPVELILFLPALLHKPFHLHSCFISHDHEDKAFARLLHNRLQEQGIRCWLDEKQILIGDSAHRAVDEEVRQWDKVLLCCSKSSLNSWWVDKEIQKGLVKEEGLWKERGTEALAVIPLNLDDFLFDPELEDWKKQHLASRFAVNFVGWDNDPALFDRGLEKVIHALRTGEGGGENCHHQDCERQFQPTGLES